jgi:hypothetical protein
MVPKEKVKIKQSSVKAADPGVFFILYTEGDPAPKFDCALQIKLEVSNPIDPLVNYESVLTLEQIVKEDEVECLLPFGDKEWHQQVGRNMQVNVSVDLWPTDTAGRRDPNATPVVVDSFGAILVTAQDGDFKVTVEPPQTSFLGKLFFRLWQMFK